MIAGAMGPGAIGLFCDICAVVPLNIGSLQVWLLAGSEQILGLPWASVSLCQ